MPRPITRKDLIKKLKLLGFDGPYSGTRHMKMCKGNFCIPIPNKHGDVITTISLGLILKEIGISYKDFINL